MIKNDVCNILSNNRNVFKLKYSIDSVLNETTINTRKMVKITTINSSIDKFTFFKIFEDV